jgi:hypothetical protein
VREGGARGALSYARNESAEADDNGGAAGVLSRRAARTWRTLFAPGLVRTETPYNIAGLHERRAGGTTFLNVANSGRRLLSGRSLALAASVREGRRIR